MNRVLREITLSGLRTNLYKSAYYLHLGCFMINYELLNSEQVRAVCHEDGPLLILAGAGSGKTRVLTHRIARLIEECDVNPYSILAITFTNKAAKEMRARVDKLVTNGAEDVFVSTFHSMCARFLRRDIECIGYDRSFSIYDTDDTKALMREVLKSLDIDTKKTKERVFINAISAAKNELITPSKYDELALGDFKKQKIASVYTEYQKRLQTNNALDFDDLLMLTVQLFKEHPEVLARYQRRFRYILVDEYQDTNHAQFELLRLLAFRHADDGSIEHNLCVVGDDDQSIYAFRGADIRNILQFENHYPDTTVIRLEQNYRSTKAILDVANAIIRNNYGRKEKTLWTANEQGSPVVYNRYETDLDEADGVINEIRKKNEAGTPLSSFAILYRTNAQSRRFEEKLVRNSMPYKLVGGVNFYSRMEVKDILSYLKTIDNGKDSLVTRRILNVPKRGIGQTTQDRILEYAYAHEISFYDACRGIDYVAGINSKTKEKITSFVAMIESLRAKSTYPDTTVKELIEELIEAIGYEEYLDDYSESDDEAADRRANLSELISKAADFEEVFEVSDGESSPLSAFLQEVSLVSDIDELTDDVPSVTLMTIHSAKGLEFPQVFLCGMEDGIFPSYMSMNEDSDTGSEIEEERRLCYVGITRAMKELVLSSAKQRMQRGEIQFNKQSRFIDEIPRHLLSIQKDTPHKYISEDSYSETRQKKRFGEDSDVFANDFFSGSRSFDHTDFDNIFEKPKPKATPRFTPDFGRSVNQLPPKKQFGTGGLPDLPYKVGDSVKHLKFGEGVVKDITAGGKDYEVTVEFPNFGVRKMLASFARLQKI